MYGFCEKWIPEALGIPYENYSLGGDVECAIIFKEQYIKLMNCLNRLSNRVDSDIGVHNIRSNVTGMHVLLSLFWDDETILYSLTDGDVKNSSPFVSFMAKENPRFNFEVVKADLISLWNGDRFVGEEDDVIFDDTQDDESSANIISVIEGLAASPEPVEAAPVKPAETPVEILSTPPEDSLKESADELLIMLRKEGLMQSHYDAITTDNGYRVSLPWNSAKIVDMFVRLAESLRKNVVAGVGMTPKMSAFIKKNDPDEIFKHTVFVECGPGSAGYASLFINETHQGRTPTYKYTVCLGNKIKKLWLVRGVNVNAEIQQIRNTRGLSEAEKEAKIAIVMDTKANSPYYRYDGIMKDMYTNVVFAVKQKCIVFLLFDCQAEDNTVSRCLFAELSRRINMSIPCEVLYEHDKGLFDSMELNSAEQYVNFAATSSRKIYDETVERLESVRENYKQYLDSALNAAKEVGLLEMTLRVYDQGGLEEAERQKAKNTFEDTMKIAKVSSICVEEGMIHVFTKNLYAKDIRTKVYHDIGTFHIMIGMLGKQYDATNTVRIFNTKYLGMGMNSRFQAPHVWEDGHLCHGNLLNTMVEAYKNRNLFDLVYQIIIFLESANTSDGAGEHVDSWPAVSDDEALGRKPSGELQLVYKNKEVEDKFDAILENNIPVTLH